MIYEKYGDGRRTGTYLQSPHWPAVRTLQIVIIHLALRRAKTIDELLNRAIRAEIPGGPELLDAIEISHAMVKTLQGPVHDHAQDLHEMLLLSRDKLRAALLKKWGRKIDAESK